MTTFPDQYKGNQLNLQYLEGNMVYLLEIKGRGRGKMVW